MTRSVWCAALALALHVTSSGAAPESQPPRREVAVTVDDLPAAGAAGRSLQRAQRTTRELLASFGRHRVPAIGFVNEGKLERPGGGVDDRQVALLRAWIDAGLELGNHTRSHPDLHRVSATSFVADLIAGERVTRPLLRGAGRDLVFFRHPFLHTGRSREDRAAVEDALKRRGYRVAPVTIDNYDYQFAAAWDRAEAGGDEGAMARIASAYVDYMMRVVAYYEAQSVAIVGREIRQVLLLHASALNGRTFDALAAALAARGYAFVSLSRALEDPAYQSRDEYFGPAGMTWLHRWAITAGLPGRTFAGEPEVPGWIVKAGGDSQGTGRQGGAARLTPRRQ